MIVLRLPSTDKGYFFFIRHDLITGVGSDSDGNARVSLEDDSLLDIGMSPEDMVYLWTKTAGTDSARACWEWVDGDYRRFNEEPPPKPEMPPPPSEIGWTYG